MPDKQENEGGNERHQIRFVARTLDGVEVMSAPISLKPGEGAATQAKIATAYWGHGQYLAGDTAYACANAFGAEGAVVKFIIEKSSGGGWSSVANLKAKVKDEKAVATWTVPAAAGAKFRFKAKTALNEQTALEFSIPAPPPKAAAAPPPKAAAAPPPKAAAAPPPKAAAAPPPKGAPPAKAPPPKHAGGKVHAGGSVHVGAHRK